MAEPKEKHHADWNDGKRSSLALEILGPILENHTSFIVENLKSLYASGSTDGILYISAVAQLKTMDDLKATLQGKILRGNKAAREIIGE